MTIVRGLESDLSETPNDCLEKTHNKAAFPLPSHTVCIGSDSKQLSHGDFVP